MDGIRPVIVYIPPLASPDTLTTTSAYLTEYSVMAPFRSLQSTGPHSTVILVENGTVEMLAGAAEGAGGVWGKWDKRLKSDNKFSSS